MRPIVILLALLVPVPSWAGECDSLADLRWMIGHWTADGDRTMFNESWTEATALTFEGTGVEQSKPDGAAKGGEALRLVEMSDGVFYISKVAHNELPIAFRLSSCNGDSYIFENPAHDFPRRLEYRRDGEDRLVVTVSDGGDRGFTLEFRRVPTAAAPVAAVLAAEDARFAAMIAANPDELRRRLAADLAYAHSTGKVENREELIETIKSGRMSYVSVEPTARDVWFGSGTTAIVRGRGRFSVKAGETPLDLRLRYLAIYELTDGNWLLRDWQSLREPD
jgi:hypothetical protein